MYTEWHFRAHAGLLLCVCVARYYNCRGRWTTPRIVISKVNSSPLMYKNYSNRSYVRRDDVIAGCCNDVLTVGAMTVSVTEVVAGCSKQWCAKKNLRRKISNVESVAIFLNVLKRDRNVDHWSVYSNVTLCILHYCLCFLYYNFETLHCHYISNNIANNAKYQ